MPFCLHTKWPNGWSGGHEGRFSRNPIPVFSAGDPCEQFCHGQGCPLFDVVHPAFPLRSRRCKPSLVPWRIVLERLSLRVTCPNHASFPFLKDARRASCGPTRKLILLRTQSLVVSTLPCMLRLLPRISSLLISTFRSIHLHFSKPLLSFSSVNCG